MAASPHHLQMSNDEQLWLMKQVKENAMTIDDAVSWKEARESELHNSVVRDDIAQNERSDENETDCDGKKAMANYNFNPTNIFKNLINKKNNKETLLKSSKGSLSISDDNLTNKSYSDLDLRNKKTYNFLIYKLNKLKQPQKRILQIDFDAKKIYLIHRGNVIKNYLFSTLGGADGQEGKKMFIHFEDGHEIELSTENLVDKTKLLRLLNIVSEQNEYEDRGEDFDSCEKLQLSFRVIKEGILDKKGIISAINWNKRHVVIRSGELAYYRVDEEDEQSAALNIIHLSPGSVAIHTEDDSSFTIATTKDSYRFRIPDSNNFSAGALHQVRDDWIAAIHQGCLRDKQEESEKNEEEKRRSVENDDVFETSKTNVFDSLYKDLYRLKTDITVTNNNRSTEYIDDRISNIYKALQELQDRVDGAEGEGLYAVADDIKTRIKSGDSDKSQPFDEDFNELPRLRRSTGVIYSKISPRRSKTKSIDIPSPPSIDEAKPVKNELKLIENCDQHLLDVIGFKPTNNTFASNNNEAIVIQYIPKQIPLPVDIIHEPEREEIQGRTPISPAKSPPLIKSPSFESNRNSIPTSPEPSTVKSFPSTSIPPPPNLNPRPGLASPPLPPIPSPPSKPDPTARSITPMRPIHWTIVPKHLIAKSMWKNTTNFDIDSKELAEMFKVVEQGKFSNPSSALAKVMVLPNADNSPRKKKAGESYLDRRTAQNLGIFMAGFKLRGDELVQHLVILKEEEGGITTEQISALIKFCPEPEMKSLYAKHTAEMGELAKEDKFLSELCRIPRLNMKLEMLLITRDLPQELDTIKPNVDLALQACKELLNSNMFESILVCILAHANAINAGNAKGVTKGIRLSTLEKICKIKTNDRKLTLLHVVVKYLRTNSPQLLKLSDEMKTVEKSQPYSTKGLVAELDVMRKAVLKVKKHADVIKKKKNQPTNDDVIFCNNVEVEIAASEKTIQHLTDKCSEIRKTVVKLITKFGESPDTSSEMLFDWIRTFMVEFNACIANQA